MSKALKAAIEANDPEAVRKAVKSVKDINRKLPGAKAPLLYACASGADKVLKVLFEAGAVAEKRNTFPGDTPFAVAAKHNQAQVLKCLWELKQASELAVEYALENAAIEGMEIAFALILEIVKPSISIKLFNLVSAPKNAGEMIRLLVARGGDVHVRCESNEEKGGTPLHVAAARARSDVILALIECRADVNAQDAKGRTPLMWLTAELEWIERSESEEKAIEALITLLHSGADASLNDNFGNDALAHCEFEYASCRSTPNPKFVEMLLKRGAKGSGLTGDLFHAIRENNLPAIRQAIKAGANVNQVSPRGGTPLGWASDASEVVEVLLEAGADPNKGLPLICAARAGNLAVVKKLISAGADIHAVEASGEYLDNAHRAADANRKFEVVDYLKSLGAGNPKPTESKPLNPGVGSWNDFSELLMKTTAEKAADAIAKLIKGKVQLNVYGQSLLPGGQAYVIARPKGMAWCNVFQIAPPRVRFEDSKKTEAFACELAKFSGASVLSIEYSDTSDAASVLRIEPDGKKAHDTGWDRDTLEEMVEGMGDETPEWAKKQLARTDEDEPSSTERLKMLAEQEKFVVAAFGLDCEPGRKVDVEFVGYGAEAFDGVTFVTSSILHE